MVIPISSTTAEASKTRSDALQVVCYIAVGWGSCIPKQEPNISVKEGILQTANVSNVVMALSGQQAPSGHKAIERQGTSEFTDLLYKQAVDLRQKVGAFFEQNVNSEPPSDAMEIHAPLQTDTSTRTTTL